MKKYFLSVVLLSFVTLFGTFTFAQETIKNVSLKFCNDGMDKLSDTYTIMVQPGGKQDLCIYVDNKGSGAVALEYNFPKASFSKGGNQICDTSNDFSKFFLDNPKRSLIVSGGTSATIKETIVAPIGMIGMYYGCLAYKLGTPEVKGMGGVFNLVVRKTAFVNLFVGGEDSIKNTVDFADVTGALFSTNKHFGVAYNDDGDLIVNFLVKNNGNTTQNVSVDGKFYNALGFEKTISIPAKKLLPGEVYEASANMGIVPFYKGLFSVRATLKGEPVFEFDVSSLSKKYLQSTIVKETSTVFIFSWIYVVVALLILGLIIKIILPKKRKIEVAQTVIQA